MILDWTSIFLSEAFFGDSSSITAIDPGLVFWMGLGAFYSIELLQHRFLGMCSEECLAATSRAHSLSQSANHNRSHRIRCLLLISSIFMYSIFPPFPRIPSEKRETARHQYSLVVFVIFSKKNRKSFGFFAWVSGESPRHCAGLGQETGTHGTHGTHGPAAQHPRGNPASTGQDGATTVSATMIFAHQVQPLELVCL